MSSATNPSAKHHGKHACLDPNSMLRHRLTPQHRKGQAKLRPCGALSSIQDDLSLMETMSRTCYLTTAF